MKMNNKKRYYQLFILFIFTGSLISCLASNPLIIAQETIYPSQNFPLNLAQVEPRFRNQWTKELEKKFQERAKTIIDFYANWESYGNGYGENEKRSYPRAMFDFLAGNEEKAITFLEKEDPEAKKHQHTDGIDYYYCFTLKGQIRKYFLYGKYLDPAYKKRMFEGAKKWTEEDPLTRPHPIYGLGNNEGRDWDISRRGRWVDGRNTDNLRAMRETSVYLMAEETGNEKTRLIYKEKIQRYVWALYHIGMGEWDSEVYHGHTFAPYLNLYDFAKDPEVKLSAKAALDWLSSAAAIKYYRGGWGGPVKRDYGGGNVALASSSARTFWLYFGDTPLPNNHPEEDTLFFVTSTYRPPLAVMNLAHKKFNKPVEILSSKPLYENWKLGNDLEPGYWETQFIGNSYQMGSLAGKFADGDVAPFKLMAYNSQRGIDYFVVNTEKKIVRPGKNAGDEIGQYRNLLIWLRPPSQASFNFQIPKTSQAEIEDNIWFFKLEKTWLAVHPINLQNYQEVINNNKRIEEKYSEERFLSAAMRDNNVYGFALEVGEKESHGSYENFKKNVKKNSQLNLQKLNQGIVSYQGSNQQTLQLIYNTLNLLPMIIRNGDLHQWSENFALYNSQTKDKSPVFLGYKEGKLKIKAGEYEFMTQVNNDRKVVVSP
ncbi:hypothetical protein VB715_03015 [Crocosphaera sp. UHCC 0190]|uniref:hypothetical protein n=1 Tax=Crocosphaera sp. UHCC 0190 TaxID=3110246 RepID=UPI002B2169E7|nr:hypothetical protein [Crocosphaera sp. UHCC 0190]MEA5508727.1 hypothetical protein [Crocosphaera sp. UHCC 0190]